MDRLPKRWLEASGCKPGLRLGNAPIAPGDWLEGLPTLTRDFVSLRGLQLADAPALHAALTPRHVSRFLPSPPTTIEGFERFIRWTDRLRAIGEYACFAIVPCGSDLAIGFIHVRVQSPGGDTAEWGAGMASEYWGTGMFMDCARMAIDFAFDVMGMQRLEARAALTNGRANGALRKLSAMQEGVLRRSLFRDGQYHDQAMWRLLREEWRVSPSRTGPPLVLH